MPASISKVHHLQAKLRDLSDEQLLQKSLELKYDIQVSSQMKRFAPAGFALVREAARRVLSMEHYDVQLQSGFHLLKSCVTEIQTGEGKTLIATLPVYLHAMMGKGAHVATVNDYLASRDAELMRPVYSALGLTVGAIQTDFTPEQRRAAYQCDITYGTSKEFGFDFLRDRLAAPREQLAGVTDQQSASSVQRGLYFVLVDEADSVLIDEARTPLIIAVQSPENEGMKDSLHWAKEHVGKFVENEHFEYVHKEKRVKLKPEGRILIRRLPQNAGTFAANMHEIETYMENMIKVNRDYHLDQHYAIQDGEIVIIDEFSGRPADGRKWQGGIHQSVEIKEGVEMTAENRAGASVTVQDFFLQYEKLIGMTGTAWNARREFKKIYKTKVVRVPTHRPCIRKELPTQIFKTWDDKWDAVISEVETFLQKGRSVLVGTRSIDRSEVLSERLNAKGIEHNVLNARHLAREAEIVALAGQAGRVTVATNMAGRGTDIELEDSVKQNGGIHVILTEIHESPRIDRQFIGRCARQGDPGTYRLFVSLEDEILIQGLTPKHALRLSKQLKPPISRGAITHFRRAQKIIQRRYFVDRLVLHRQQKEQRERLIEMGQDPYLDVPR